MTPADVREVQVTPGLLAEEMGWSRFKAYREMARIERAFPGVVRRVGKQLVADATALASHVRGLKPSRLEREVKMLRSKVEELENRLDVEVAARIEFQRKAHEWFMGRAAQSRVQPKKKATAENAAE